MADIIVNLEPVNAHISPLGFHQVADEFLEVARLAHAAGRRRVALFLCCHAIELGLKAFLKLHGVSRADLQDIRHNLKSTCDRAVKQGLDIRLRKNGRVEFEKANAIHSSHGGLRYFDLRQVIAPKGKLVPWPDFNILDALTARLLELIRVGCINAASPPAGAG